MIAKQLLEAGLLQFGLFEEGNVQMPYRLRLEMLPAYPELLQNAVYRAVQSLMGVSHFNRLVAHPDAIPFASAISLSTSVSLVYSRGRGELPVFDLVGAYDVGHPACLIINTLTPDIQTFLNKAEKVGLEIHTILELVSIGNIVANVDHRIVFTMQAFIHDLQQQSAIPEQMANAVLATL